MQYVICYDIADNARRNRLAEALKDFGPRIQESVFLADLDDELASRLRQRVQSISDPQLDAVHIFTLCRNCAAKTEVYGIGHLPRDQDFYVV